LHIQIIKEKCTETTAAIFCNLAQLNTFLRGCSAKPTCWHLFFTLFFFCFLAPQQKTQRNQSEEATEKNNFKIHIMNWGPKSGELGKVGGDGRWVMVERRKGPKAILKALAK